MLVRIIAADVAGKQSISLLHDVLGHAARRSSDQHGWDVGFLERMQHVLHTRNPRQTFDLRLEHIILELLVDFGNAQCAAMRNHDLCHVWYRSAGALPTEVLVPLAAIVVRDLNLTVMPERLRIDESTVQIPEHGFEQHSYLRPHARTPIGAFTLAAFHCSNRMRQP